MTNYLTGLRYEIIEKLPDNQKSKGLMIRNSTAEFLMFTADSRQDEPGGLLGRNSDCEVFD
jgi:hypothetical protein